MAFTLMYAGILIWASFSLDAAISDAQYGSVAGSLFGIALIISIFLSLLYSSIIMRSRQRNLATLKCIGYTNGNCRTIIIGEIIFTTISGFIIVLELLFHVVAFLGYYFSSSLTPAAYASDLPLVSLEAVIITFSLFVAVQLAGIAIANRKISKTRPIVALKKVGM